MLNLGRHWMILRIDILWPLEDFSVLSLLQGPLPWSPLRYVATLNFQSQIFLQKQFLYYTSKLMQSNEK